MSKTRGLGRGLESLIPTQIDAAHDPTAQTDQQVSRTQNVFISDVKPNPEQPRKKFREQELNDLISSIRVHGVLQPIIVTQAAVGYTLVAGERRLRAARRVGLKQIPAIIRSINDQARLEVALIENLQRDDLTPLELATALVKLNQQFNQSFEVIAERLGKAPSTLTNTARLLNLPTSAKHALEQERISEGHARQILALGGNPKAQQSLLDNIVRHGWSVRRAEQFVVNVKRGGIATSRASRSAFSETYETKQLGRILKTKVVIQPMARGGRLIIAYKNVKDLTRITKRLSAD